MAYSSERILQRPAGAHVHVHITACDQREIELAADRLQALKHHLIGTIEQKLHSDPKIPPKALVEPLDLIALWARSGEPQDQASLQYLLHVIASQGILTFLGRAPPARNESTQAAVTGAIDGERDEPQSASQTEFRSDNDGEIVLLSRRVGAHHSGDRALIRDRQRPIAELKGAHHELLGMRGAAQESEITQAVKLGVLGRHGGSFGSLSSLSSHRWQSIARAYDQACTRGKTRVQPVLETLEYWIGKCA